ncbi:hypothetical protein ILUMI_17251 [Ignelater luminosus]|uniref:Uncharacterized protein n=1 Tax=Ignelater luminosus TaxID=2038154 RepID=A0A8K0CRC8_IGNLU|nr:hypothetical protein ILUMI_17251 [Ignelater luminosus]
MKRKQLVALYFDGRRDKTLNVNKVCGTFHHSFKMEDHYILLKEPGDTCTGYVTCKTGAGDNMKQTVGCGGTVVSTGLKAESDSYFGDGTEKKFAMACVAVAL